MLSPYLSFGQENIQFPIGAGVIDVTKAPYFAKGDGMTDDTDAINQAMLDHPDGHFIIYLPNGTYLVSDRIDWPRVSPNDITCGTEQSCRYTILQGQNRDSTIIKLIDNAPGYQDETARKSIIWCGQGAAQRFRNAVRNLTVNVGSGNPGAVGMQFNANNQGGVFDVTVKSEDGQGVYGIDLSYTNEIGPLLIKNVEVDGFRRAVQTFFNVNSMTFEDITIRNQSEVGIFVQQQVVNIRGLQSFNDVTAVRTLNQGSHVVLIDSELNGFGDAANQPAIYYGSNIFIRNVSTNGYRNAVNFALNGTTPVTRVAENFVDEFVSSDPIRLCDNVEKSLNLPIQDPPEVPLDDPSTWVNVEDFGAVIDKNGGDDTQAIQDALNSGASTIYVPVNSFRTGGYTVNSDVIVPATVRRIIGTEGGINGPGKFIISGGTEPLIIERLRSLGDGIQHDSPRTLICKSTRITSYSCSSGADLFVEDVLFPRATFLNQNVWARQLNTEVPDISILNDNSNLWILGLKTEKRGTKIKTINGGKTEVLGAHIYSISEPTDDFMFEVENASLSLAGVRETNFAQNPYVNLIKETRGGVTRELVAGQANFGINGSGFPLFVAYVPDGANTAPEVTTIDDISIIFPLDSVIISGTVNDDGLPGSDCFTSTQWELTSGPASAAIADPSALETAVSFSEPGVYTFSLIANDGDLSTTAQVNVYVYEKSITTEDHDGDGVPSGNGADATIVARGGTDLNYGGEPGVSIRNSSSGFHRKGLIRFDLSTVDTDIVDAGLQLEIATTNTGLIDDWTYNVFGLVESSDYGDGKLDEFWAEGTKNGEAPDGLGITYRNAPGNGSGGGGVYDSINGTGGGVVDSLTVFLGTFQIRDGIREIIEFRSDALKQFLNDDTNGIATLIITRVDGSNNVIAFSSKENTSFIAPTLNFTLSPKQVIGEVGVASTDHNWQQVTLRNTYTEPIVVMGPSTFVDDEPVTIRVANAAGNSFEWRMDEWEYLDEVHAVETSNYLVMEAGEHYLTNGKKVIAANSVVDNRWITVPFSSPFNTPPTIIGQCASINEDQAVVIRIRNVTTESFQLRVQEEEFGGTQDGKTRHAFETVSWIAIEQGAGDGEGTQRFEAINTPDAVRNTKWYHVEFAQDYPDADRAFIAMMQTIDGFDPSLVRYRRDGTQNSLTPTGVDIFIEEELSSPTENLGRGETNHTSEVVGYFLFNGLGDVFGIADPSEATTGGNTQARVKPIEAYFEEYDDSANLAVYPNPLKGVDLHIFFTSPEKATMEVQMTDLSGKLVHSITIESGKEELIDTSGLGQGIYLIKGSTASETWVRRVIVR